MSASREKKNRQEQAGAPNPKTAREAQQRKEERRSNLLYAAIAVAFLVVAVVVGIWKTNIIQKTATAATVDGEKLSAAEVTFYYQNAYNSFYSNNYYLMSMGLLGLNTSAPLENQTIGENDAAILALEPEVVGQTWKSYFVQQGLEQMATVKTALKAAQDEGFVYPDSVQEQYDTQMASLRTAAQANGMSASQYLQARWGGYMTEKVYSENLLRMLQYAAYGDAYEDSLNYSSAELDAAYNEDKNAYDKVDFEYIRVDGAAPTTDADGNTVEPTEEESEAALDAAKEVADDILAAWQGGQDPDALASQYDNAFYTNREGGSYSSSDVNDWAFDEARKGGDTTVLQSASDYYVVLFHQRYREEYSSIDVRHILIQPAAGYLSEGDDGYADEQAQLDANALAQAEDILKQWQEGEATEESFAALAQEYSADGSRYEGGLYTEVCQGDMVTEFNDWCFDPARQPGDTGVVGTDYGYHVMYFSGTNIPCWQVRVSDTLKNEAIAAWEDGFAQGHTFTQGSGVKYVA